MSDELLWRLFGEIDEAFPKDLPLAIALSRLNEPLLDRRTLEFVDRMERCLPQASMWMYTNASPLSGRVLDRVAGWTQVELFNISFNHHERSEYERIMGLPFDRTVANIDALHARFKAGELAYTPCLSRVGDGSATDDLFREWCADRWPGFTSIAWEEYDYATTGSLYDPARIPDVGCHQWYHLSVLASGEVVFCCADCEGLAPIDSVAERSLLEVYNEPSRRALRTGCPSRRDVDPCLACVRL